MPSFDVVCETDMQEMDNAVNQTHKEITTRYDFKGGNSSIALNDEGITIIGDDDYKLNTVTSWYAEIWTRSAWNTAKRKMPAAVPSAKS